MSRILKRKGLELTEENRAIRIKMEVRRAEESLKAATLLLESDLYDESISSAYYSIFHMTKAILITIGEDPATHQGLITLFTLNFIKSKIIESEYSDILIEAKEDRETSDYDAAKQFSKEDAKEKHESAIKFKNRILAYLNEKRCL